MKIRLISSGKADVLGGKTAADLYIDCRGMVNPYRDPVLGGKSGDDPVVQEWVREHNSGYVGAAVEMIYTAYKTAASRNSFKRDPLKPLTVCFFCMAGVHRSRGMKNVVGSVLGEMVGLKDQVEIA